MTMGISPKLLLALVFLLRDQYVFVKGQSPTVIPTTPTTQANGTDSSLTQHPTIQAPIASTASSVADIDQPSNSTAVLPPHITSTSKSGTSGIMKPSLDQLSTTQAPIITSTPSSSADISHPPRSTSAFTPRIASTIKKETSGNSTAAMQFTTKSPSTADTNQSSSSISLPTASTLTTIGEIATTAQPLSTSPPITCSQIKKTTGEYVYSSGGVTRNLTLDGPNNVFDYVAITCDPPCAVEKDSNSNTLYTVQLRACVNYNISIANFTCGQADFNISDQWNVPPDAQPFTLNTSAKSTSIKFTWDIEKETLDNCSLKFDYVCTDREPVHGTRTSELMDNLNPNTNYSCTATVKYNGEGIKTIPIHIQTEFGEPNKITKLECNESASNNTIAFRWDYPGTLNRIIDGYLVKCGQEKEKEINETTSSCSGLPPFTEKRVEVRAFKRLRNTVDKKIEGQPESRTCRTAASTPGEVRNVHASVTSNKVTITCDAPTNIYGPKQIFILDFEGKVENTKCYFVKKDLSYLTTYDFKLRFNNGNFSGPDYIETATTKYNEKALIGFLAFLIIVTSIALIVVLYKIYKLQKSSSSDIDGMPLLNTRDDEKHLLNVDPIPAELLLETYKKKVADEGRLFLAEFQSIPRVFSKIPIKDARESYNQVKNRYVDILPYDDNRVELSVIHGEPGSDYINASFINGFKEPRKYIAAQGPKDETTDDFWRMVWEQKSTIIVMVTRCEEGNRNKCAEYWPTLETGTLTFGDVTVVIKQENRCPDYIIRKLHVTNKREKSSERDVTHIQFISWPDHGVPDDPYLLLKLRRRVNAFSNFFSGPIIVHCSAGVGRTGTYISIDAMLEGLDSENRVDVYGYVVNLRRQRCLMVQVEAQYILIHHALVDYNRFGETEISVTELAMSLANMKKKDPPTDPSPLEAEFQRLPTYKNWRQQNAGNNQDNANKNRNPHIVPYEFNRVGIRQDDENSKENVEDSDDSSEDESEYEESTKYINASFITGYWSPRAMIAAQGPLNNTISDFWLMIFQRKVKVIVMLTSSSEQNQNSCAKYWGDEKQTYEDIEVEEKEVTKSQSYTVRLFEVRHAKRKETRKIYQYQYEKWNAKELPEEPKELATMIQTIRQKFPKNNQQEEERVDKFNPVLVHCSDGAQQTGIFCSLWNLLECAESENAVDIFQTVKSLRKERPGFVTSFEDYQFLYDTMALAYPSQNGQVKKSSRQEDKVEIMSETNLEKQNTSLSQKETSAAPIKDNKLGEDPKSADSPVDTENAANGSIAPPLTDIPLKID